MSGSEPTRTAPRAPPSPAASKKTTQPRSVLSSLSTATTPRPSARTLTEFATAPAGTTEPSAATTPVVCTVKPADTGAEGVPTSRTSTTASAALTTRRRCSSVPGASRSGPVQCSTISAALASNVPVSYEPTGCRSNASWSAKTCTGSATTAALAGAARPIRPAAARAAVPLSARAPTGRRREVEGREAGRRERMRVFSLGLSWRSGGGTPRPYARQVPPRWPPGERQGPPTHAETASATRARVGDGSPTPWP
jgi:hypothetical protein